MSTKSKTKIGKPIQLQLETQQLLLKLNRLEKAIQALQNMTVMTDDYFNMLKSEINSYIQRQQYKQIQGEENEKEK